MRLPGATHPNVYVSSEAAAKRVLAGIGDWIERHLRSRMFNPKIRGWLQYYGRYYAPTCRSLARWAYRKYKKLRGHLRRATHWVARISRRDPGLFAHWQLGVRRGSLAGAV